MSYITISAKNTIKKTICTNCTNNFSKSCNECYKDICGTCNIKCKECDEHVCNKCLILYNLEDYCYDCEFITKCEECNVTMKYRCNDCDKKICIYCDIKCEYCNEYYCDNSINKNSDKDICYNCTENITKCRTCNNIIIQKDWFIELQQCENCEKPTCNKCLCLCTKCDKELCKLCIKICK
jgi:hypothetical protein